MGIDSIGSAVSNYFSLQKTPDAAPPTPAAPPPAAESPVVPVQYQSGFETAAAGKAAAPVQVPPEVAKTFIDMNNMVADNLMKSGNYAGARAMNDASKTFVKQLDLADKKVDPFRGVESAAKDEKGPSLSADNRTTTFKDALAHKDAQIAQAEKMSKVVGKPIDLHNVQDVKSYFDTLSQKGAPTAQIHKEFGEYVKANYAPTRYEWGSTPALSERDTPSVVSEMFATSPKDMSGRRALDCEGMSYLTGAIFQKNPRFEVWYADGGSHLTASVFEKGKTKGFSVDSSRSGEAVQAFDSKTAALMDRDRMPKEEQQRRIAMGQHGSTNVEEPNGNARRAERDLPTVVKPKK